MMESSLRPQKLPLYSIGARDLVASAPENLGTAYCRGCDVSGRRDLEFSGSGPVANTVAGVGFMSAEPLGQPALSYVYPLRRDLRRIREFFTLRLLL